MYSFRYTCAAEFHMISFYLTHILQSLLVGLITYVIGLSSLSIKRNELPTNTTSILIRGIFILVVILSFLYTSGKTIFAAVPILVTVYYFTFKDSVSQEKPTAFQAMPHVKKLVRFVWYQLIALVLVYSIHQPYLTSKPYNSIGNYAKYLSIHNLDSWLEVFSILLFKDSNSNLLLLVVIPLICGLVFQSIDDYLLSRFSSLKSSLFLRALLMTSSVCVITVLTFNLHVSPMWFSDLQLDMKESELLIAFILLVQGWLECKVDTKQIPCSWLLICITNLSITPWFIAIFFGFNTVQWLRKMAPKYQSNNLLLLVVLAFYLTIKLAISSSWIHPS